jgi:hypothetical protein
MLQGSAILINVIVSVLSLKLASGHFGVKEMSWGAAFKLALMAGVIGGVLLLGVSLIMSYRTRQKAVKGAPVPADTTVGPPQA